MKQEEGIILILLDLENARARRVVLTIKVRQDSLVLVVGLEEIQPRILRSQYRIGKSTVGQQVVELPISLFEVVLKPRPNGQIKTHPARRFCGR